MGQLALGFRSLLIKALIFVIMAALLAWALGGALLPRTLRIPQQSVEHAGRSVGWQMVVREDAEVPPHWLLADLAEKKPIPIVEDRWLAISGIVTRDKVLCTGGQLLGPPGRWVIIELSGEGSLVWHDVPDRLEVERQLARVRNGLEIQDLATIHRDRAVVLDPRTPNADQGADGAQGD